MHWASGLCVGELCYAFEVSRKGDASRICIHEGSGLTHGGYASMLGTQVGQGGLRARQPANLKKDAWRKLSPRMCQPFFLG